MKIELNVSPELFERGARAVERIADALEALLPSPLTEDAPPEPIKGALYQQTNESLLEMEAKEEMRRAGFEPDGGDDE